MLTTLPTRGARVRGTNETAGGTESLGRPFRLVPDPATGPPRGRAGLGWPG